MRLVKELKNYISHIKKQKKRKKNKKKGPERNIDFILNAQKGGFNNKLTLYDKNILFEYESNVCQI